MNQFKKKCADTYSIVTGICTFHVLIIEMMHISHLIYYILLFQDIFCTPIRRKYKKRVAAVKARRKRTAATYLSPNPFLKR